MKQEIEGLIIKETAYGESSKIINILTENKIVGCMAKGSRSLKSKLRIGTLKITYASFVITEKKDKLGILVSADVKNDFRNIKKDMTKISYATFLIELAEQVMKHSNKKEVFNLLIDALVKIDEGYDPVAISNILELKYLDFLGVMPIIDECAICGDKNNIATLSSNRGGYVCNKCLTNELIVSEKTIKLIRMFYYVDIKKISNLEISNQSKKEISDFLDEYYDLYTGLYLNSKKLLKNINKVG